MEFDFTYGRGGVRVRLEHGFELLGSWIEQELLTSPQRIFELKGIVDSLSRSVIQRWHLETAEHLLVMESDELQLLTHAAFEDPSVCDEEGLHEQAEQVACGLDDFHRLLCALEQFLEECLPHCISERLSVAKLRQVAA